MNVLDIILIIPLLFAIYRGFRKGLVYMAASLLALILGIIGAIKFRSAVGILLDSWFTISPDHLNVIAFAVTFLLIVLIVHSAAFLVDKLIKAVALNFVNRMLGVVFGLIVTSFILSMLLWPLNTVNEQREIIKKDHIEGSLLWKPLSAIAPTLFPYLKRDEFNGWIPERRNPGNGEGPAKEKKKDKNEGPTQMANCKIIIISNPVSDQFYS